LKLWLFAVLVGGATSGRAQSEEAAPEIDREYVIKAAYLYNFGRYIEWPAQSFPAKDSPFVIGVLGRDPFGPVLDEIARTKKMDGRTIVIRRFASVADVKPCQILFLAAPTTPEDRATLVRDAAKWSTLLVGEEANLAEEGATICFFLDQNKVRFEINLEAARREQLKISSKLLSLARIVGAGESLR